MSSPSDPNDPKIPVLTLEQLEQADKLSGMLIEKLPKVDPLKLADTIGELTEARLAELMERSPKTEDELRQIAAQLGWWNVLLIIKLRAVVLEWLQEHRHVITPGGGGEAS